MLMTPGRAPPTFTHTRRTARPMVALARKPAPNTDAAQFTSSARRTGPFTMTSGVTASVVPETPTSAKSGSQIALTAAMTTGRYSGRQPAITAFTATRSTVARPLAGATRPISSSPRRPLAATAARTRSTVGGTTGRPSVTPRAKSSSIGSGASGLTRRILARAGRRPAPERCCRRMSERTTLTDDGAAALAAEALRHVASGQVVGLGTGHAATAFVRALGAHVAAGLDVRGVPTSEATAALARGLGIKLLSPDDVETIDVAVDGADEIDPRADLIKGYGGALLREKVVATLARRFVVLAGDEKLVPVLGTRGRLPVEVVPFAAAPCRRRAEALGYPATLRASEGRPVVTDNGNLLLDCRVGPIADPPGLEAALRAIPGLVGTGLFLGMHPTVLVWDGARLRTLRPAGLN